jgi:hypothetical protein
MIANAILDIRLQTMNMTDQEALDLMLKQCFQEKEEAAGKLRRAKLSATQLPTYYARRAAAARDLPAEAGRRVPPGGVP